MVVIKSIFYLTFFIVSCRCQYSILMKWIEINLKKISAFKISVEMLGWNKSNVQIPCSGNRQVLFEYTADSNCLKSFLFSNKLLSILNILCNNTQNTSIQQRDACYGCFFRAGSLPPGNTQLISLSQCATIYLNNTGYQQCALQLQVRFNWKQKKIFPEKKGKIETVKSYNYTSS